MGEITVRGIDSVQEERHEMAGQSQVAASVEYSSGIVNDRLLSIK